MKRQKDSQRSLIAVMVTVPIMVIALVLCILMVNNINLRMNESATSNLLNTTQVIEDTLENYIQRDYDSLYIIGELYKNDATLDDAQMQTLCTAMGFERIGVADSEGRFSALYAASPDTADVFYEGERLLTEKGYSDAYFGNAGRQQMTLWLPVSEDGEHLATVFGEVVLSKYYSANVFTFYEGEGRTYLFNAADGAWVLRSLGIDGTASRQDDLYSLLLSSGNDPAQVEAFRQAVQNRQTGTDVFDFNGRESYICFMPLSSSEGWSLATVIPRDVLLKEAVQVQQMIRIALMIVGVSLFSLTLLYALWQIRRTKEKETAYREALFMNVSSNIDSAFLIYQKNSRQTVFVSENVGRLLNISRDRLQEDAKYLFDWCKIPQSDPQVAAFLRGELTAPAVREVCVADGWGAGSRCIRLELIPADLGQEIAVLTDITKDKDVQQSLLEATQRAEAASNAKNDFLSAMSHDIRTPMNGIVGMTAIAAAHIDDKVRVKDCLNKINDASAHLLTIINEVLDMSHIESGRLELSRDPFNIAEPLQNVLSLNYPGIEQKQHTLHVRIHPMEHEQVIGDVARLQRVVSNLLSNAIKYTPEGGTITLELKEKPSRIKGCGCYELLVQDNGIGMSPEFMKRLFQPFEREEDVRISRIQGTGLGMSIAKNIANLMMGDITAQSEKHKGTTFKVTVNLLLDNRDQAQEDVLTTLPVLVVDDDHDTCEVVTGMLQDIGIQGEWADNGPEAVEKVVQHHRDREDFMAVLLDWKMPGMDGIETARRIRAAVDASIPVIILTAYDWSEIETEARAAGVNDFLSKPLYKAKLRQKLEEVANAPASAALPAAKENGTGLPPGKRILLVEDNPLNQEIAAEILQMLHLEVQTAENGVDAVTSVAVNEPGYYDLILMDIQMPKMNGYDATKTIRAMGRVDSATIPIVAMTADTFTHDVQAAYAAGMNEHLAKPISVERLVQVLEKFLSAPQCTQEGTVQQDAVIT